MKNRILFLVLLAISQAACSEKKIEVQRRDSTKYLESYYTVSGDACDIAWTVRRFTESPGFGISEESKCTLPLQKQVPYREALLKKIAADTNNLQGMRNFVWGRLKRGDATDEFAKRLTMAALKSPAWNKKTGKLAANAGGDRQFFQNLLNKENVFSEITASFAAMKLNLRVGDVERVIVGPASMHVDGVAEGDRLPVDAFVSFSVSRND